MIVSCSMQPQQCMCRGGHLFIDITCAVCWLLSFWLLGLLPISRPPDNANSGC